MPDTQIELLNTLAIIFVIAILTLLSLLNKFPTRAWYQNPLGEHTLQF